MIRLFRDYARLFKAGGIKSPRPTAEVRSCSPVLDGNSQKAISNHINNNYTIRISLQERWKYEDERKRLK